MVVCADGIEYFVTSKCNVVSKCSIRTKFPSPGVEPGLVGESYKS